MSQSDITALKEILRQVSDYKTHTLFSIHDQFRLSPERIMQAVYHLEKLELISLCEDNQSIRLCQKRDTLFLSKMRKIFTSGAESIPSLIFIPKKTPKIAINEPYLPEFSILSKELKVEIRQNNKLL